MITDSSSSTTSIYLPSPSLCSIVTGEFSISGVLCCSMSAGIRKWKMLPVPLPFAFVVIKGSKILSGISTLIADLSATIGEMQCSPEHWY
jgi:hypothetical protein